MLNFSRFKPAFWDYRDAASGPEHSTFSFRRKWLLIVGFTMSVTLTPLLVMIVADYRYTKHAVEKEFCATIIEEMKTISQDLSNRVAQRQSALKFLATKAPYSSLTDSKWLSSMLKHLQAVWDGFVDLSVLDPQHRYIGWAGPTKIKTDRPTTQFDVTTFSSAGTYVSGVVLNPDSKACIVLAIRRNAGRSDEFILSANLDADLLEKSLARFPLGEKDDLFLVNPQGGIQTEPRFYGHRFENSPFPLAESQASLELSTQKDHQDREVLVGIFPIKETPFFLVTVKPSADTVVLWVKARKRLIGFLLASMMVILVSVVWVATYLVNRIYVADRRRIQALHQVEYANKMASIGRLASGVAHEVNNPLAIINQKTGLVKDLIVINEGTSENEKVLGLVDDVLASVKRCGAITRRMLDFARHMETSSVERVEMEAVLRQVLAFLEKEADRRRIDISLRSQKGVPLFRCDRGKLQQIFLNLINNAFAAMEEGGTLEISIATKGGASIRVIVSDSGHGIPMEDLNRVFEPFFSTRQGHAGTGLGLSVTYGLVSEMGGEISVKSKVGHGTSFTISLPVVSLEQTPDSEKNGWKNSTG